MRAALNDGCDLHPDHDRHDLLLLFDPVPMTIHGDAVGQYAASSAGGDRYGGASMTAIEHG